jgi:hypothetical protein
MSKTGRLFKCISHNGVETEQVKKWFDIGQIYEECDIDIFGEYLNDVTTILVYAKKEIPMELESGTIVMFMPSFYVSVEDFKMVTTSAMYLN